MSKNQREDALLARVTSLEGRAQDESALATALGELVDHYWEMGRHQSAEAPMLRRLELLQHIRGPKHTAVAKCLHDLAFLYDILGRDAEVEDFASRAMAMWAEIDGYANGHTTRMLELLARLYAKQGQHEKLTALLGTAISRIEPIYSRGYYDHSLAKLVELLNNNGRGAELHKIAGRIRALLGGGNDGS